MSPKSSSEGIAEALDKPTQSGRINLVAKVKTNKLKQAHFESLANWGYTAVKPFKRYDAEPLKSALFEIGGQAVILENKTTHKNFNKLVTKGEFFLGNDVKFWKLKAGKCHDNVDFVKEKYPHFHAYEGYALSEDGIWRFHSWAFDTVLNKVLETTEKRVAYYGIKQ